MDQPNFFNVEIDFLINLDPELRAFHNDHQFNNDVDVAMETVSVTAPDEDQPVHGWQRNNPYAVLDPDYAAPKIVEPAATPRGNQARMDDNGYVHDWHLGPYHTGDRTQLQPVAPLHQTTVKRPRRPRAASASSSGFTCETCGSERRTKALLTHHERTHGPPKTFCSICGKGFVFAKDHRRHEEIHDPHRARGFCQVPGCKTYPNGFPKGRKDNFERHMRNKHPDYLLTPTITTASENG